jgi:hypothetical protein
LCCTLRRNVIAPYFELALVAVAWSFTKSV